MDINTVEGLSQHGAVVRSQRKDAVQSIARADTPVTAQAAGAPPELGTQPMEAAVSSIKEYAQSIQRNLNFDLDDSTGQVVVKVTDGVSGEVIRQIPSEEALRLAESLEDMRSLLFRAEA
ncbi:flagellar protein FlaG [Pseudomonas benzenivorans]|uniref:Flagellar protein FlaG n=1 Tax=Pseudomonas benzenivorans TaxID=556533 RepID=A0ABY5H8D5_9PSED|nr:flagellar protein FlaG [Pseudomonas benzenivorans]UTW07296.1 flagellar protein FlaG [Pseudomonas benzenivorans]